LDFSGYEVKGLEHIPTEGPVLIVFYHGALPIDFYYLFAKVWLYRNRRVRVVADKFVFKIPGIIFIYSIKNLIILLKVLVLFLKH
jgi:1-acyl-sn-glycerol-3-phosphate acyltransferase